MHLKLYTSTAFKGHYPVGTAAIIITENIDHAVQLLTAECVAHHIPQAITAVMIDEVTVTAPVCIILDDGNY